MTLRQKSISRRNMSRSMEAFPCMHKGAMSDIDGYWWILQDSATNSVNPILIQAVNGASGHCTWCRVNLSQRSCLGSVTEWRLPDVMHTDDAGLTPKAHDRKDMDDMEGWTKQEMLCVAVWVVMLFNWPFFFLRCFKLDDMIFCWSCFCEPRICW